MVKKRISDGVKSHTSKKHKSASGVVNEYDGFYPSPGSTVKVLKLSNIDPDDFFKDYVQTRTPLVIDGVIPGLDISKFQPENIVNFLNYNENLLVEKKFKGGFGSGTQRIHMKFDDLMKKMKKGDDYYLTTQYVENEPAIESEDDEDAENEDEEQLDIPNGSDFSDTDSIDMNDIHDDFDDAEEEDIEDQGQIVSDKFPEDPLYEVEAIRRVKELVQKPLTNLILKNALPLRPKILEKLAPQQINLWMGSSSQIQKESNPKIDPNSPDLGLGRKIFGGGVSSGLHHDHSDNLYVPLKGSKRFTIFAPNDGINLYTVGKITKIYKSGVIDYENNDDAPGWRKVRDDGALVTEVAKWKLDNEPKLSKSERKELIKLIEEEDAQLGDDDIDTPGGIKKDPPSFSTIPAAIVHLDKIQDESLRLKITSLAKRKWPNFFKCSRLTVDLKPGQMFYLPAGWFHEVSSFGDLNSNDNIHIALNYWYSPPNGIKRAYSDKYWKEDFQRTKESCDLFKKGLINF